MSFCDMFTWMKWNEKKSFLRRLTCVKPLCCSHIFPLHYEFVPLSFSYDTKGDLIKIHVKTDDCADLYAIWFPLSNIFSHGPLRFEALCLCLPYAYFTICIVSVHFKVNKLVFQFNQWLFQQRLVYQKKKKKKRKRCHKFTHSLNEKFSISL